MLIRGMAWEIQRRTASGKLADLSKLGPFSVYYHNLFWVSKEFKKKHVDSDVYSSVLPQLPLPPWKLQKKHNRKGENLPTIQFFRGKLAVKLQKVSPSVVDAVAGVSVWPSGLAQASCASTCGCFRIPKHPRFWMQQKTLWIMGKTTTSTGEPDFFHQQYPVIFRILGFCTRPGFLASIYRIPGLLV